MKRTIFIWIHIVVIHIFFQGIIYAPPGQDIVVRSMNEGMTKAVEQSGAARLFRQHMPGMRSHDVPVHNRPVMAHVNPALLRHVTAGQHQPSWMNQQRLQLHDSLNEPTSFHFQQPGRNVPSDVSAPSKYSGPDRKLWAKAEQELNQPEHVPHADAGHDSVRTGDEGGVSGRALDVATDPRKPVDDGMMNTALGQFAPKAVVAQEAEQVDAIEDLLSQVLRPSADDSLLKNIDFSKFKGADKSVVLDVPAKPKATERGAVQRRNDELESEQQKKQVRHELEQLAQRSGTELAMSYEPSAQQLESFGSWLKNQHLDYQSKKIDLLELESGMRDKVIEDQGRIFDSLMQEFMTQKMTMQHMENILQQHGTLMQKMMEQLQQELMKSLTSERDKLFVQEQQKLVQMAVQDFNTEQIKLLEELQGIKRVRTEDQEAILRRSSQKEMEDLTAKLKEQMKEEEAEALQKQLTREKQEAANKATHAQLPQDIGVKPKDVLPSRPKQPVNSTGSSGSDSVRLQESKPHGTTVGQEPVKSEIVNAAKSSENTIRQELTKLKEGVPGKRIDRTLPDRDNTQGKSLTPHDDPIDQSILVRDLRIHRTAEFKQLVQSDQQKYKDTIDSIMKRYVDDSKGITSEALHSTRVEAVKLQEEALKTIETRFVEKNLSIEQTKNLIQSAMQKTFKDVSKLFKQQAYDVKIQHQRNLAEQKEVADRRMREIQKAADQGTHADKLNVVESQPRDIRSSMPKQLAKSSEPVEPHHAKLQSSTARDVTIGEKPVEDHGGSKGVDRGPQNIIPKSQDVGRVVRKSRNLPDRDNSQVDLFVPKDLSDAIKASIVQEHVDAVKQEALRKQQELERQMAQKLLEEQEERDRQERERKKQEDKDAHDQQQARLIALQEEEERKTAENHELAVQEMQRFQQSVASLLDDLVQQRESVQQIEKNSLTIFKQMRKTMMQLLEYKAATEKSEQEYQEQMNQLLDDSEQAILQDVAHADQELTVARGFNQSKVVNVPNSPKTLSLEQQAAKKLKENIIKGGILQQTTGQSQSTDLKKRHDKKEARELVDEKEHELIEKLADQLHELFEGLHDSVEHHGDHADSHHSNEVHPSSDSHATTEPKHAKELPHVEPNNEDISEFEVEQDIRKIGMTIAKAMFAAGMFMVTASTITPWIEEYKLFDSLDLKRSDNMQYLLGYVQSCIFDLQADQQEIKEQLETMRVVGAATAQELIDHNVERVSMKEFRDIVSNNDKYKNVEQDNPYAMHYNLGYLQGNIDWLRSEKE